MCLLLFVFALLGLQLYGNVFVPPTFPSPPRANFDSIGSAMITVFILTTGESWNEIWRETTRAVGISATLYFVVLILFSTYGLLSLLLFRSRALQLCRVA